MKKPLMEREFVISATRTQEITLRLKAGELPFGARRALNGLHDDKESYAVAEEWLNSLSGEVDINSETIDISDISSMDRGRKLKATHAQVKMELDDGHHVVLQYDHNTGELLIPDKDEDGRPVDKEELKEELSLELDLIDEEEDEPYLDECVIQETDKET